MSEFQNIKGDSTVIEVTLETALSCREFVSPLHGNGLRAEKDFMEGDIIFQEKPYCFLQTLPNRQVALTCGECSKFIGSTNLQLQFILGQLSRQDRLEEYMNEELSKQNGDDQYYSAIIPCAFQCGEFYCSENCRRGHWHRKGHSHLCTGQVSEEEAETNPLIRFKVHSATSNEIFLLVAELFTRICLTTDELCQQQGYSIRDALEYATKPLSGYVRHFWWDVAISPSHIPSEQFTTTLKQLVTDSYELLSASLLLQEKGYDIVLNKEYMSRTIGMFEQNNVGVRLINPISIVIESLQENANELQIETILNVTKCIAETVNGMECEEDFCQVMGQEEDDDDEEGDGVDEEGDINMLNLKEGNDNLESPLTALKDLVDEIGTDTLYLPLDGTAFYIDICKINHSCDPNVIVKYTCIEEGLVAELYVLREIKSGEELVQSYIDQSLSYSERQLSLRDYGFVCHCDVCTAEI